MKRVRSSTPLDKTRIYPPRYDGPNYDQDGSICLHCGAYKERRHFWQFSNLYCISCDKKYCKGWYWEAYLRRQDYLQEKRGQQHGCTEHHTEREWFRLVKEYAHRCLRCKNRYATNSLHRDHIVPLKDGGKNTIDNIQPLCCACNVSKGNATIDYRSGVPTIITKRHSPRGRAIKRRTSAASASASAK